MRRVEFIGVFVFVLLGAHVVQQASLLPYSEKYGPGPGFLPFWLGWCWIGLAIMHFINLLIQPHLYPGKHPFPAGASLLRVGAVYCVVLGTIFLLGFMGLLIAFAAMIAVILLGVERMPRVSSAVVTAGISVVVYVLFAIVLNVPFPRGPLGV